MTLFSGIVKVVKGVGKIAYNAMQEGAEYRNEARQLRNRDLVRKLNSGGLTGFRKAAYLSEAKARKEQQGSIGYSDGEFYVIDDDDY